MQEIGFDIIGDLNLSPNDSFNWENKQTSLYCIVTGNISSNLRTITQTLMHLAKIYQGVFYVPGMAEYETGDSIPERIHELLAITESIPNVCMLHQHVAVIDGIAITGVNGWSNVGNTLTYENVLEGVARHEDTFYLRNSVSKLQRHLDVKRIIVVSNAVPHADLYFKENPGYIEDQTPLCDVLDADTEKKVSHWVFGTYDKPVDAFIDYVNYMNNPRPENAPYWPKRLTILI
jgi:hypothetical protein